MLEQSKEYLDKAIRNLQIADHMIYVTYPLFNERKLLLKIFNEINKSIINCIKSITGENNWNYIYNRFFNKEVLNLELTNQQIKIIKEIIELNRKHKDSAMEFVRKEKVVIMSNNLNIQTIDDDQIKAYLIVAKELLLKTKNIINNQNTNY